MMNNVICEYQAARFKNSKDVDFVIIFGTKIILVGSLYHQEVALKKFKET